MGMKATEVCPHWEQAQVTWFSLQTVQIPQMTITRQLTVGMEAHIVPTRWPPFKILYPMACLADKVLSSLLAAAMTLITEWIRGVEQMFS